MNEEYQKVRLKVGEWHDTWANVREVEFNGRLLADSRLETGGWEHPDQSGIYRKVYETAKGKIVLWRKDWDRYQGATNTATMEIFDSLDELEGHVPSWLFRDVQRALGIDVIEHLDI